MYQSSLLGSPCHEFHTSSQLSATLMCIGLLVSDLPVARAAPQPGRKRSRSVRTKDDFNVR